MCHEHQGRGCESSGQHRHHHEDGCCGGVKRRFKTPEEERAEIEKYISEMKKEIAGAEARLSKLS